MTLDNPLKRAAFALRFGDVNPLISDQLTGSSKILYIRDIKERVSALAPFLHYDADPYPVISDGRIKWIIDAYTTTNRYPYGETADTGVLADGSGLDHGFNYVRNSVKAVVDAYDGTVDFYVMPVDDPIIEAYRDAFPDLFTDFEEMPDDLKDHLRYPEDLFRVQTTMWARYHVDDPGSFYEGNDYWDVARDPGTAGAGEGTSVTNSQGETVSTRDARIDPYYLFTELPGADQPEFILMRPFVPTSRQDDSQLLTAFMVGKSDRDDYGKLQVFVMPRGNLPDGPAIVQGNIQSDAAVSQQETLLSGSGSIGLLRQPHGHPDRRRPRLRAAVLRHLRRDGDPRPREGDRLLRGRGGHRGHPRGGADLDLRRVAADARGAPRRRAAGRPPEGDAHRAGGHPARRGSALFDEADAALPDERPRHLRREDRGGRAPWSIRRSA